jgi:hypothetical protein
MPLAWNLKTPSWGRWICYRGLAKNTGQIVTLFALANLWLARKRLLPLVGEVRPQNEKCEEKPRHFTKNARKQPVFHIGDVFLWHRTEKSPVVQ